MDKRNIDTLKTFANQYNLDWRIPYAILMNESRGYGLEGELMKHRFEEHIYKGFTDVYLGKRENHPSLPGLDTAWIRKHTLPQLRLMSYSIGIAQIMVWHYDMLGFKSPEEMWDYYKGSEDYQVRDFLRFCLLYRNGKFLEYLKKGWLKSIAKAYNGAGYAKNKYIEKLIRHIRTAPV